jgi:hypothetical protein
MSQLLPDEPDEPDAQFHRDRREHAGAAEHLDDDRLARLTEEERVAAGLDDYDPDEVPPATDDPADADLTQTDAYQQERDELLKKAAEGELTTRRGEDFPPTRYDES